MDELTGSAVIACELGPNCAPIIELIWGLRVQRGLRVRHLQLLTNRRGEEFLKELLHALHTWETVFGDPPTFSLAYALDADGERIEDDVSTDEARAWMQARWRNYRAAIDLAGPDPVVFAIASNRQRTVLTTSMFTLLARQQDACIDVRVSEPRVEGAKAGFYFPDQTEPCADEDGLIDPTSVEVYLVELRLPRLRRLLQASQLETYDAALAATETRIDDAELPTLTVEWGAPPALHLNGQPLPLSPAQALWFSALALARHSGDGWSDGLDRTWLEGALRRCQRASAQSHWRPFTNAYTPGDGDAAFRRLRSVTRKAMLDFCKHRAVRGQHLVIPTHERVGQSTRQRIALPPGQIRLD